MPVSSRPPDHDALMRIPRLVPTAAGVAAVTVLALVRLAAPDASAGTAAGTGAAADGVPPLTLSVPAQAYRTGCAGAPVTSTVSLPAGSTFTVRARIDGLPSAGTTGTVTRTGTATASPTTWTTAVPACLTVGRHSVTAVLTPTAPPPDAPDAPDAPLPAPVTVTAPFTVTPAPAAVTIAATPTRAVTGGRMTVKGAATWTDGRVRRALSGARVTLQYRAVGSATWRTFARPVAPRGAYSVAWTLPTRTSVDLRAGLTATPRTRAASSRLARVTRVAPPAPVPLVRYPSCAVLNARHPHGVGLPTARDRTSGTPVTTFLRNAALYRLNTGRDRDRDGIACERR